MPIDVEFSSVTPEKVRSALRTVETTLRMIAKFSRNTFIEQAADGVVWAIEQDWLIVLIAAVAEAFSGKEASAFFAKLQEDLGPKMMHAYNEADKALQNALQNAKRSK